MTVTIRKCANGYIIEPGGRERGEMASLDNIHVASSASECWKIACELLEGKKAESK